MMQYTAALLLFSLALLTLSALLMLRLRSAVKEVDRLNQLIGSQQVASIAPETDGDHGYESQLEEEKNRLESSLQELVEEKAHLAIISELTRPLLRQFIGAYNRQDDSATLEQIADRITFLLEDDSVHHQPTTEDILTLLDSTLVVLAPALQRTCTRIIVAVEDQATPQIEIATTAFRRILARLILSHIAERGTAREPGAGDESIVLHFSLDADHLVIEFSEPFSPRIPFALDEMITTYRAGWHSNQLRFPVSFKDPRPRMIADCGLTALVIADLPAERTSLTHRLGLLGVTCTTDFKSSQLDLCLVSDHTSRTFLSISPYLPQTTYVITLNARALINRPYWLQIDDPPVQSELASLIEHVGQTRDESSQINVLSVDDSIANARLLTLQLTELGHTVTNVSSGQEAIEQVRQDTFQIIFMDIQMPDMNGVEATRKIRALGNKTPIFGLTAHATSQEKEVYREAGMDDVLIKPVRIDSLRSILRRLGRFMPRPPAPAPSTQSIPLFDKELSLINANHRPELAAELIGILVESLGEDLDNINASTGNHADLKTHVHKLHGAVRYCGVPRLARAIEKLEAAVKQNDEEQLPLLLNLLNGEITALESWYRDNPDPFGQRTAGQAS